MSYAFDGYTKRMEDAIAEARESAVTLLMSHGLVHSEQYDAECRCGLHWTGDELDVLEAWARHVTERLGFGGTVPHPITADVFKEEHPIDGTMAKSIREQIEGPGAGPR